MSKSSGRPSAYDVALAKGDFRLPKDAAHLRRDPFEDDLGNFITFWKYLGCPHEWTLYRVLDWENRGRDREQAAQDVGLSGRESVRQILKQLKNAYRKNKARLGPHR